VGDGEGFSWWWDDGEQPGGEPTGGPAGLSAVGQRNPIETAQAHEDNCAPLPNGWKSACGARTRNGTPCRRPPLAGRTRCRLHGGASPAGISSPHFKNGRRSRYLRDLPGMVQGGYQATLDDGDLTSLRDELALLIARVRQLLPRLEGADGPTEQAIWAEVRACILHRVRAALAESKRLVVLRAMIPAERALLLIKTVMAAIRETVKDQETLRRLQDRLIQLLPPRETG
jgi:hypothetical protein